MTDIKKLIEGLLVFASQNGADLHICPKSVPFARFGDVDGKMTFIPDYADSSLDVAVVKALVMELLTPEQKTELQKHKFLDFSYTHGNLGRFRACVYTQRGTHALSIHPLPFDVPDIYSLDFTDDLLHTLNKIIMEKCGLVVVAGDSSIRLSQTLAALVDLTNQQRECHISTIENPIKYLHRHKKAMLVQKEIGSDVPDFNTALRQLRNENPDVVVLNDLWVNDFLPVVEMAQERLVWVSLKLSMPNNSNITNILAAIKNITTTEAQRLNISPLLTPCPKIIIIHHEGQGGWTYGTGDG